MTARSFPHTGHIYDLAIVGAGLAGSELAYHTARQGLDVLLVTQSLDTIGNIFEPQLTVEFPEGSMLESAREQALPETGLWAFHRQVKHILELSPGIHVLQSCVTALQQQDLWTLTTWEGIPRYAKTVVLAVGSFLGAKLHMGNSTEDSGRLSEVAYDFLYQNLKEQGLKFKTQTRSAPDSALPYQIDFQVLCQENLSAFAVQGFKNLYALGQCTEGAHSYQSIARDAKHLAGILS